MPSKLHFAATVDLVTLPGAHGCVFDQDGYIALMHRGRGVRAQLSAESAQEIIRGLLAILPDIDARDRRIAAATGAELSHILEERK